MITLLLLVLGAFWESSMDVLGSGHNFEQSIWKRIADFFDSKGLHFIGHKYWDNRMAWRNKWANGNPLNGPRFLGSNTFLVYLMDGWHLAKAIWLVHLFAALVLYKPITASLIIDFFILISSFGVAHELFFRLLQSKRISNKD
jgi:hypothetical protein